MVVRVMWGAVHVMAAIVTARVRAGALLLGRVRPRPF